MRGSIHISTRSETKVPITVMIAEHQDDGAGEEHVLRDERGEQQRPDGRQAEHQRDDDAARDDIGEEIGEAAGERIERGAHRVFQDDARLGQALGARRHDIGLAQLVEQIRAHDADELRRAGDGEDEGGQRQVLQEVPELREAPRRELEIGREQPADVGVEELEREIHQDEGEEEIRYRQPDEAEEGEEVVAERILPDRGVDADRQGDAPGQDDRGDRDHHGHPQFLADHLGDRPHPLHRLAEIAFRDAADPFGVLDVDRPVEAVEDAQGLGLLRRDQAAARREPRDIGVDEIAGRQLDDDEGQNRDRPDRDEGEQQPADRVGDHGWVEPAARIRRPPSFRRKSESIVPTPRRRRHGPRLSSG